MAKKTKIALTSQAVTIKQETAKEANTAVRVGGTIEDVADSYLHLDDWEGWLTTYQPGSGFEFAPVDTIAGMLAKGPTELTVQNNLKSIKAAGKHYQFQRNSVAAIDDVSVFQANTGIVAEGNPGRWVLMAGVQETFVAPIGTIQLRWEVSNTTQYTYSLDDAEIIKGWAGDPSTLPAFSELIITKVVINTVEQDEDIDFTTAGRNITISNANGPFEFTVNPADNYIYAYFLRDSKADAEPLNIIGLGQRYRFRGDRKTADGGFATKVVITQILTKDINPATVSYRVNEGAALTTREALNAAIAAAPAGLIDVEVTIGSYASGKVKGTLYLMFTFL